MGAIAIKSIQTPRSRRLSDEDIERIWRDNAAAVRAERMVKARPKSKGFKVTSAL